MHSGQTLCDSILIHAHVSRRSIPGPVCAGLSCTFLPTCHVPGARLPHHDPLSVETDIGVFLLRNIADAEKFAVLRKTTPPEYVQII